MTLRISIPRTIEPDHGNYAHKRHLYEALLRLPPDVATVGVDLPESDFAFDGNIHHNMGDPHAFAFNLTPSTLINPEYRKLLPLAGFKPDYYDDLDERQRSYKPWDAVKGLNENPAIKVASFVMDDPLREAIGRHLRHAHFIPLHYMPPEWIFNGDPRRNRPIDVYWRGASGPWHILRLLMLEWLRKNAWRHGINYVEKPLESGLYERDVDAFDAHQREYACELAAAKIICMDGGIYDFPVSKYFEVMACGAMLMAPMPRDAELLGFRDGVNMVDVTWNVFEEKLHFYLKHTDERLRIAAGGYVLAHRRNTCGPQARRFVSELEALRDATP